MDKGLILELTPGIAFIIGIAIGGLFLGARFVSVSCSSWACRLVSPRDAK